MTPLFYDPTNIGRSVGCLRLVLLFLELLGEILVVLGDKILKLLLPVFDVGLLQRRAPSVGPDWPLAPWSIAVCAVAPLGIW